MKINPFLPTTSAPGAKIAEKQDSSNQQQRQNGQHPQNGSQNSGRQDQRGYSSFAEQLEEVQVTEENVQAAVAAFSTDIQALANGLKAAMVESGSTGLSVVLQDVSGNVIRQLTGEEFLKLRSSASSGVKGRGKILDQKL